MSSWMVGGKNEPLICKEIRESYLQDLPNHVPDEVIKVSRYFLDEGNWKYEQELERILSNELMKGFWRKLRLKFNKKHCNSIASEFIEQSWREVISRSIRIMAFKGGRLPDMTVASFHNARMGRKGSGVAGDIHRLKNKLNKPGSAYKNISELSLLDLVTLCSKSENNKISEKGKVTLSALSTSPNLLLILAGSNFQEILVSLLEQIEKEELLSSQDKLIPVNNIPQLNRKNAQRSYFSENFLDTLFYGTDQNCWALVAIAENVVFNLPEDERIEGHHLRDRTRK